MMMLCREIGVVLYHTALYFFVRKSACISVGESTFPYVPLKGGV